MCVYVNVPAWCCVCTCACVFARTQAAMQAATRALALSPQLNYNTTQPYLTTSHLLLQQRLHSSVTPPKPGDAKGARVHAHAQEPSSRPHPPPSKKQRLHSGNKSPKENLLFLATYTSVCRLLLMFRMCIALLVQKYLLC